MWNFIAVARIAEDFGAWYALVTLARDGVEESFFITFGAVEPTLPQAQSAGEALALKKNLASASIAEGDSVAREFFFGRFAHGEIADIYAASASNKDLFAYVKLLEINPTVNRKDPRVPGGLHLLEAAGLLAAGRANEILGW